MHNAFSLAQIFGYFAFVFGVSSFLQKNDHRFRILLLCESISYVFHFWLLGNPPAMASSFVATLRMITSLYTRSLIAAVVFVTMNVVLGIWLVHTWLGVVPVLASAISTVAVFMFSGITMRATILVATLLWLVNNIASGSIGGTALESCIAIANSYTIWRLIRQQRASAAAN